MASILDKLTDAESMKFIDQVADPFKTLPHLPKNITEILVQISPWLVLLGLIAEVLGVVNALSWMAANPVFSLIALVISAVSAFLMYSAFTPLKNREMKGWILLFWINLLSAAGSVVSAIGGNFSSIVGGVVGILIGLYVLFEMRSFYGPVQATAKKIEEVTK